MYRFGERPLTWLFVMATLCADVTLPVVNPLMSTGAAKYFYTGLILGQLWLAGAWLVSGSVHRLLRAAVFILLVAGLTTLILVCDPGSFAIKPWGRIFGSLTMVGAAAAIGGGLGRLASRTMFASDRSPAKVQYAISELLGWMIIVAVASWALRVASFRHLASPLDSLIFALSSSVTAGFAVTLAARHPGRGGRVAFVAAVAFLIGYGVWGGISDRIFYYGANLAFAYLALAVVVRTLDVSALTRRIDEGGARSISEQ